MSTFDSTKIALPDIIRQITEGKVQLPDFQRGWIWDDEHIRSLLISVARSFPVGAVMLLEIGGEVKFQVRPIENVAFQGRIPSPERLILDGQQRLTTLTQVLAFDQPVKTHDEKGRQIELYYYININSALESDALDEAFVAVEPDRKNKINFGRDIVLDLSSPQLECKEFYFPCSQILNSDRWEEHLQEHAPDKFARYMKFRQKVLTAFRQYQLPIISLGRETSKEAVCLVFEKVNTGGVPLSVFELVTASFAAENFNLRDDWYGSHLRKVTGRFERIGKEPLLKDVAPTDFLQAISLLHTYEMRKQDIAAGKTGKAVAAVSAKRVSVLALSLDDYKKWADDIERGFMLTAKFLRKQCFLASRDIPYKTQLVPFATLLATLKERWLEPRIFDKLNRWFWCGVFGELYGGAVETRIASDVEGVLAWIEDEGGEPRTIFDANFQPSRLLTLRSRLSAAYKGLNTLILKEGARDFFWKATIKELEDEDAALDIHHIFPRRWCEDHDIKPARFNAIINKTPISAKANRMIGGRAPAEYLAALQMHKQVKLNDADMDDILASHFISPSFLRSNGFDGFFEERKKALLDIIEKAIGKTIDRADRSAPADTYDQDEPEIEEAFA